MGESVRSPVLYCILFPYSSYTFHSLVDLLVDSFFVTGFQDVLQFYLFMIGHGAPQVPRSPR